MKIQTIVAAGLMLVLSVSATVTNAQAFDEPAVKILPTLDKGVLKLVYAYQTDQPVNVKFYNADGFTISDEVKGDFKSGFSKKYDVRKMTSRSFWIEVATPSMSVTYKLTRSGDDKSYIPSLEKTAYNHSLVASNN